MRKFLTGWAESARKVGGALIEVWRAELTALGADLKRSGRSLRGGIGFAGLAVIVGFWTVGLGLWLVVEALSLVLEPWQAGLAVFGAGVLSVILLIWLAKRRFRAVEAPLATLKRRGREHAEWLERDVAPDLLRQPTSDSRDDDETRG